MKSIDELKWFRAFSSAARFSAAPIRSRCAHLRRRLRLPGLCARIPLSTCHFALADWARQAGSVVHSHLFWNFLILSHVTLERWCDWLNVPSVQNDWMAHVGIITRSFCRELRRQRPRVHDDLDSQGRAVAMEMRLPEVACPSERALRRFCATFHDAIPIHRPR